jgi:hypothetical protein
MEVHERTWKTVKFCANSSLVIDSSKRPSNELSAPTFTEIPVPTSTQPPKVLFCGTEAPPESRSTQPVIVSGASRDNWALADPSMLTKTFASARPKAVIPRLIFSFYQHTVCRGEGNPLYLRDDVNLGIPSGIHGWGGGKFEI